MTTSGTKDVDKLQRFLPEPAKVNEFLSLQTDMVNPLVEERSPLKVTKCHSTDYQGTAFDYYEIVSEHLFCNGLPYRRKQLQDMGPLGWFLLASNCITFGVSLACIVFYVYRKTIGVWFADRWPALLIPDGNWWVIGLLYASALISMPLSYAQLLLFLNLPEPHLEVAAKLPDPNIGLNSFLQGSLNLTRCTFGDWGISVDSVDFFDYHFEADIYIGFTANCSMLNLVEREKKLAYIWIFILYCSIIYVYSLGYMLVNPFIIFYPLFILSKVVKYLAIKAFATVGYFVVEFVRSTLDIIYQCFSSLKYKAQGWDRAAIVSPLPLEVETDF